MSGFGFELPTLQNWSCHNCGGCCRQHGIFITDAEHERIEKQGWTAADGIPEGQPIFVRMGGWLTKRWWRLAHQPDGACVFLDERGLCRIHAKFGEEAKPLACRIYPYAFHPGGRKVVVSLRFSCPSVVRNQGDPVREQSKELRQLARQVVPENVTAARPPDLKPGTQLEWADFLRFARALELTIEDANASFLSRLLRAVMWIGVVEQSRFDKVLGDRLEEFLNLVRQAAAAETPDDVTPLMPRVSRPTPAGRVQFRLLAGHYARSDTYASERGARARWRLLQNALRLTRGRGNLPPVQPCFREVPFDALEQPFGLPDEADELFTRYFLVKLQGLHFCGRPYYNVPLVEGFYSLALVYPCVLWLARWLAASEGRTELGIDDVGRALSIADHHHGYSPALGTWGFRKRVQSLAKLGDIPKLCAWYSR